MQTLLLSNFKGLAGKRSEAEVLQRRADSGTDLPPPRAQRSEMSSRKGDFKYEYKLTCFEFLSRQSRRYVQCDFKRRSCLSALKVYP